MKEFIFWTGMLSVFAGVGLQFQKISEVIMPLERDGLLMHLFGAMAIFLGIMLIFCSRDLKHRGCLVVWEGILRLAGFGLMAGYGIFAGGGISTIAGGFFDLIIGIIYLVALPRFLGTALFHLLLDR